MHEQEKVINRLQILRTWCAVNPDYNMGLSVDNCVKAVGWLDDAMALVKALEPRLVTESDFKNADPYGYLPVWVEDKDDNEIICDCITKHALTEPDEDYHYRYWTSRPTAEQREAIPWET